MTDEEFMIFLALSVLLLVASPILWMFAKKMLIQMGWIAKLSKLDKFALDQDVRGSWEKQLASNCITGTIFLTVFGALLFLSALYGSIDLGQPVLLISGVYGSFHLGITIRQLTMGWQRASTSRYVKQIERGMELRRESLIHRLGEEIIK